MEYYGRTLFEISIELQGYNRRWEKDVRTLVRPLYTLTYNLNAEKSKRKRDIELMPLPSEAEEIAWRRTERRIEEQAKWEHNVKGKGDGSGISS